VTAVLAGRRECPLATRPCGDAVDGEVKRVNPRLYLAVSTLACADCTAACAASICAFAVSTALRRLYLRDRRQIVLRGVVEVLLRDASPLLAAYIYRRRAASDVVTLQRDKIRARLNQARLCLRQLSIGLGKLP